MPAGEKFATTKERVEDAEHELGDLHDEVKKLQQRMEYFINRFENHRVYSEGRFRVLSSLNEAIKELSDLVGQLDETVIPCLMNRVDRVERKCTATENYVTERATRQVTKLHTVAYNAESEAQKNKDTVDHLWGELKNVSRVLADLQQNEIGALRMRVSELEAPKGMVRVPTGPDVMRCDCGCGTDVAADESHVSLISLPDRRGGEDDMHAYLRFASWDHFQGWVVGQLGEHLADLTPGALFRLSEAINACLQMRFQQEREEVDGETP